MRRFVSLLLIAALPPIAETAAAEEAESSFRVAGYVPTWALGRVADESLEHVTDILLFSVIITDDGAFPEDPFERSTLRWFQRKKATHNLRLHLCVGGWGRSEGFAPMVLDEEKRAAFVAAITAYCVEHGFDGIDYDWEIPANAQEHAAYVELMKDTRAATRPHGLELSVAVDSMQLLTKHAYGAIDHLNVMTYDMGRRHSTFEASEAAARRFLRDGVPARKLMLGVPFYGRGIEDRNQTLGYAGILEQFAPAPDENEAGGLYFNGPELIARKAQYAREAGFAGIMIWEISTDVTDDRSLLCAIASAASE